MNLGEINHLLKIDLQNFWDSFDGIQNNGKGYSVEEKLIALAKMSEKVYFHRAKSLKRYRKHFNENYKGLWKLDCFVCEQSSNHRHHIVLLKNGGGNSKLNRLPLCRNCHGILHPWLREGDRTTRLHV